MAVLVLPFIINAIVIVEQHPDRLRLYAGGLHWEAFLLTFWESVLASGFADFYGLASVIA
jgi:hypothetical protein